MVSSTVYCDNCGTANRPQARFCIACGQAMPAASSLPLSAQAMPTIYPLSSTVQAESRSSSSSSTGLLPPNSLLTQRYLILGRLGQGGMGAVYKAADTKLGGRLVAVKEMAQKGLDPQEIVEAANGFKREALMLAGLPHHPHLPSIYDHFSDDGHWYLVMDYIEGETLEEYRSQAKEGRLPVEEVLDIGIQLATILGYLHAHQPPIVFRDLKPANVMRTADGQLYLIDFGIARHFKQGQAKDTIAYVSAGYAAPEQYGKAQTTSQSDIYSLGATLHHLLSGSNPSQSPFRFAPLINATVPAELGTLIVRMVDMDVDKRPTSMVEVKEELQRIATSLKASQLAPTQYGGGSSLPPTRLAVSPVQPPTVSVPPPPSIQVPTARTPQKTKEQWISEGETYWSAKRYQEALDAYAQAIRLDPNNPEAYFNIGRLLSVLERYQEALDAYEQAIRLDPNNGFYYTFKADTLFGIKHYQEALAAYEQAIRLNPSDTHASDGKYMSLILLKGD
jgi:eukaryotic-like serine/threonine-protein kinase